MILTTNYYFCVHQNNKSLKLRGGGVWPGLRILRRAGYGHNIIRQCPIQFYAFRLATAWVPVDLYVQSTYVQVHSRWTVLLGPTCPLSHLPLGACNLWVKCKRGWVDGWVSGREDRMEGCNGGLRSNQTILVGLLRHR